jgi:hypothetical protein
MTDGTTKIKAASDGGTSADLPAQDKPVEEAYGFARLREAEIYHRMGLVQSALDETEHMIRVIHDKARDRWLDHDGSTEPLDNDEIGRWLSNAYQCASKAATVIDEAAMQWLDTALTDEPIPLR